MSDTSLMPTYARLPVSFVKGEGAWLFDAEGRRYLDCLTGVAVCSLGHAHPAVTDAICSQAQLLLHTSNYFQIEPQQQLGDFLTRITGMDRVFFCNSGTEANEAAIKLARLYGHQRQIERPVIAVMENSFHGRTLASLSATGNAKIQQGFGPLVDGFSRIPYNDLAAVEALIGREPNLVAILVEPVQGEGGVSVPDPDYLPGLRTLCNQHQLLLMLDEVQTGVGRTGQWFAFQHYGILPDVLTSAKALGNGVPIGACLTQGPANLFKPGQHGSTFGGNALACRAALAVLTTIEQQQLLNRAQQLGTKLLTELQQRLGSHPAVVAIRGQGLMLGIELTRDAPSLMADALSLGVLINVTRGNVIRLLPPLILTDEQAEQLIQTLQQLLSQFGPGQAD